jgi:hypothetical protein
MQPEVPAEVPRPQSTSPLFTPNPDAGAPMMPQPQSPSTPTPPAPPSSRIPGFQPPQHEGPTHNNRSTLLIGIGLVVLFGIFYATFSFIGSRQKGVQTPPPTPASEAQIPTIILTDEPSRPSSASGTGTQSATLTRSPSPLVAAPTAGAILPPPPGISLTTVNHQNPAYSFKFPEPQNCPAAGCQNKSTIAPPGYEAGLIESRGSTVTGQVTNSDWVAQYVSEKDGTLHPTNTDWYMLGANFYQKLQSISYGQSAAITNREDGKSYIFTRETDRKIAGTVASTYTSTYTLRNGKETKYALFHAGNYTYMIAVEWLGSQNDYIFDSITSSFALN